jgi:hypothetical protein
LKGSDKYGENALDINDEIVVIDIGGSRKGIIKGRIPEHEVKSIHLKRKGHDEEVVRQLTPLIHPEPHIEQCKGQRKVEWSLQVRNAAGGSIGRARPHEYPVEHDDEDLEDEDIQSHAAVIIRIIPHYQMVIDMSSILSSPSIRSFENKCDGKLFAVLTIPNYMKG